VPKKNRPSRHASGKATQSYEKEAFDYYLKNPEAHAQLRAPLLEDEVMNFLIGKITSRTKREPR